MHKAITSRPLRGNGLSADAYTLGDTHTLVVGEGHTLPVGQAHTLGVGEGSPFHSEPPLQIHPPYSLVFPS